MKKITCWLSFRKRFRIILSQYEFRSDALGARLKRVTTRNPLSIWSREKSSLILIRINETAYPQKISNLPSSQG